MIRRKGNSWEVRAYVGRDPITGKGRTVSRSFPAKPGERRPPRHVVDAEARLRTEARDGKHPVTNLTVAQVLDTWLLHTATTCSPWTVNGYRGIIDRYLKPEIGDLKVAKLTPARIDALYHTLRTTGGARGTGLAPLTVNHVHALLRRALSRAERHGHVVRNPAALAHRPTTAIPTRSRAILPDEVNRLLAQCEDDPTMRMLISLAADTGARRGELCGLRWSDIDFDRQTLLIERSVADPGGVVVVKAPKTNRVRRFPIGEGLLEELREHRALAEGAAEMCGVSIVPDAYVLSEHVDGAEPFRPEHATGRFRAIARRAGIRGSLHDLRHGHVTWLLSEGVAVAEVAARVGHANAHMTLNVYAHALPANGRLAATIADARRRRV